MKANIELAQLETIHWIRMVSLKPLAGIIWFHVVSSKAIEPYIRGLDEMERLAKSLATLDYLVRVLELMYSGESGISKEFEDQVRQGSFIEPNSSI